MFKYAENLLRKIVKLKDPRFAVLSMNQSAGLSRRFMMLRMMLCLVPQRSRRNVRMKLLATQPTPSAPSGQRKSVLWRRNLLRNTLPSLDVLRNQGKSVLHLDADSKREKKSVMTKFKPLYKMLPRNSVPLNLREHASM